MTKISIDKEAAKKFFEMVDEDKSGELDKMEFKKVISILFTGLKVPHTEADIDDTVLIALQKVDLNRNQKIEFGEFFKWVKEGLEPMINGKK